MYKSILRNGDVLSAAALAALGVFIFMQAREWNYYSDEGPGPAFFPMWYGAAMVVLSLLLIVTVVAKPQQSETYDWPGVGRALGTWLAFAVCAALMGWLGFVVSFALLTFFVVTVVFRESAVKASVVAVCTTLGFYVVFPLALQVPLPVGVLGF